MHEYLHPDEQLRLIRLHHEGLRGHRHLELPGRERRRFKGERGSLRLRLRLRPRYRARRAASAAGLTRTAGFGAARSH